MCNNAVCHGVACVPGKNKTEKREREKKKKKESASQILVRDCTASIRLFSSTDPLLLSSGGGGKKFFSIFYLPFSVREIAGCGATNLSSPFPPPPSPQLRFRSIYLYSSSSFSSFSSFFWRNAKVPPGDTFPHPPRFGEIWVFPKKK